MSKNAGEDNLPSGVPRAYRLHYDAKLAEKAEAAVKASANGSPQGGRTADVGTGEGGEGQITAREVTPSARSPRLPTAIPRPAVRSTRGWRVTKAAASSSHRCPRRACRRRMRRLDINAGAIEAAGCC